jgi:hypothetical protein
VLPPSVDVKLKPAVVAFVGFGGLAVIEVSGGAASIVQVYPAGVGSVLPAGSVARTWKVWLPVESPEYAFGLVQIEKPPPSSWHWNVLPPSVDVKLKLAAAEFVGLRGLSVMNVSGGPVSTVHV